MPNQDDHLQSPDDGLIDQENVFTTIQGRTVRRAGFGLTIYVLDSINKDPNYRIVDHGISLFDIADRAELWDKIIDELDNAYKKGKDAGIKIGKENTLKAIHEILGIEKLARAIRGWPEK